MFKLPSIVIVTTPTRYQGLLKRWGSKGQARFRLMSAIAHQSNAGSEVQQDTLSEMDFDLYEAENATYEATVERLRERLDVDFPVTLVERRYLPNYEFRNSLVVVVVGPDGLVANTAKYVGQLPIVGVNPDPARNDGVLLPFSVADAPKIVNDVLKDRARCREVTMAQASLSDGQQLLAFNDFFIGRRTHASARYTLNWRGQGEPQSSSGVLVATGAGCTGWLSSVFNMMSGVNSWTGGKSGSRHHMAWEDRRLAWVVREPFASRHSQASLVAGEIESGEELVLDSLMPEGGAIFSDGIEDDYLEFNSGTTVRVGIAQQQARLVVP